MKTSALIAAACALWLVAMGVVESRAAGKPAPNPSPPTYPPARIWQTMSGNEVTGGVDSRVYMFGGDNASGTALNDLWYFSVATGQWTLLTPASRTQSLYGRKLAALSCGEGQCVLFGGSSIKLYNETWYFAEPTGTASTVTWGQVSCRKAGACPAPRYAPLMAFDPSRRYRVSFGGKSSDGLGLGDTWTLSGTRWTRSAPVHSPPARGGGSATFVPSHASNGIGIEFDKVVIFGGDPGPTVSYPAALCDLWAWTGSDWEQVSTGPDRPCLTGATIGWDDDTARVVVTGGFKDAADLTPNTDTWYFRFVSSSSGNWSVAASTACAPIRYARGAYDTGSGQFVFFGGSDGHGIMYDDTLVCP
jgi:hypothetical protein